jgi:hypothetical protein
MSVRHHAAAILGELEALGYPTLLLKGLALQELVYSQQSLRMVSDCDVLVRPEHARPVFDHLLNTGWSTAGKHCFGPGMIASYPAMNFTRHAMESLDLHWRLNYWSSDLTLHQRMWDRALPMTLDGTSVYTLDHTDHLLHAIAHGVAWEVEFTTRWVPDAMLLIESGKIDWDRLLHDSIRAGFVSPLKEAVQFLTVEMACQIPDEFVGKLGATRPARLDSVVHWIRNTPPRPSRWVIRSFFVDYILPTAGLPLRSKVLGYPLYLYRRAVRVRPGSIMTPTPTTVPTTSESS